MKASPTPETGPWYSTPVAQAGSRDPGRTVPVSVVGTHGGAGTSTVASLLRATDCYRRWPEPGDGRPPHVVLVARTNAAGLMAASKMLAGYCSTEHPDGPYLAGFVLVADAPGRLPKPLKRRITILASATMVYRLHWVSAWRLTETTYDPKTAEGLRRFAEHAALTQSPAMRTEHEGGSSCNA
jgi:hypothetical protein